MPSYKKVDVPPGDIYRDPKRGGYHVRVYSKWCGERVRSLKTKNLKDAIRLAKDVRAELYREEPGYQPQNYSEIAVECFKVKHKDNRDSTVREAAHIYENRLLPAFGHLPIDKINDTLWLEQVETWKADTSRKTFANLRKYAIQIDNYAFRQGYKKFRCDFPISDPKKRVGRVLTDQEFARVIQGCLSWFRDGKPVRPRVKRDLDQGKRLRLFNFMARYMGMRRREITALPVDQIDLDDGSIELFPDDTKTGSRTGRGRKFAIAPEALPFLEDAVARAGTPWLFPNRAGTGPVDRKSINRSVKRLGRAVSIDYRPHDLRHTFLTVKLLIEKKPPMDVAIYAGVSLQVIQDVYLHPTVEDTRHVVGAKTETSEIIRENSTHAD